jgi:hypothetical protein
MESTTDLLVTYLLPWEWFTQPLPSNDQGDTVTQRARQYDKPRLKSTSLILKRTKVLRRNNGLLSSDMI